MNELIPDWWESLPLALIRANSGGVDSGVEHEYFKIVNSVLAQLQGEKKKLNAELKEKIEYSKMVESNRDQLQFKLKESESKTEKVWHLH